MGKGSRVNRNQDVIGNTHLNVRTGKRQWTQVGTVDELRARIVSGHTGVKLPRLSVVVKVENAWNQDTDNMGLEIGNRKLGIQSVKRWAYADSEAASSVN